MARIRTIKPEAFTSESNCALEVTVRWLFAGLWTHCDDAGRCVDNPRLIKAAIYPLDDEYTWQIIDGWLGLLAEAGKIERYEVSGQRLIQVQNWKHQSINKPRPSTLPPPPDPQGVIPGLDVTPPGLGMNGSRPEHEHGTAAYGSPPGDVPAGKERKGKERKGTGNRAGPLPDGFMLTEGSRRFAADRGMTPTEGRLQVQKFKDHHLAKGSRFVDWQAAWRTWVGNWAKWEAERAAQASSSQRGTGRWGDTSV